MIRDIAEFRRLGVASRRVDELTVPVAAWRAAMCRAARQDGTRVRTFVVPSVPDGRWNQMVFAVRIDPPPSIVADQHGLLRRWRIDELGMPFRRWRAVMHKVARRQRARVHTFVVPPGESDDPDQVVYVLWAGSEAGGPGARHRAHAGDAGPHPAPGDRSGRVRGRPGPPGRGDRPAPVRGRQHRRRRRLSPADRSRTVGLSTRWKSPQSPTFLGGDAI
jgi:hypothetical protein